jgi:phospholipase C
VDGSADTAAGKYTLTFGSGAKAGAAFLVTSGNRADGPWTYTTEAGKTISDTWNSAYSGGSYDLTVHGPNGFLRTFKGAGKAAGPEVTARHTGCDVELTLANKGAATATLTLTNGYGGQPQAFRVRAGATVKCTVDLRASKCWYDLTVVSDTEAGFLRRFAGHVENGRPGVSDPALITV